MAPHQVVNTYGMVFFDLHLFHKKIPDVFDHVDLEKETQDGTKVKLRGDGVTSQNKKKEKRWRLIKLDDNLTSG